MESHRQFVTLARALAESGLFVFRFDYRGMGDSAGKEIAFMEAGPDISAAIDTMNAQIPGLEPIILWGLCDAATINLLHGVSDKRVGGLVLLNPLDTHGCRAGPS